MNRPSLIDTVLEQLGQIFVKACIWCWIKIPLAFGMSAVNFMFGIDTHENVLMLVSLITMDMITAVLAEYKVGHAIESRKMLKTGTKLAIYGLMASAGHLTEAIIPGTTFVDSAIISFLAITELISILENAGKVGYAIPKKLLNRLDELRDK